MNWLAMTVLLLTGWGLFAWSARRRWRLMMVGRPEKRFDRIGDRVRATLEFAFVQKRMPRYKWAGVAHTLIFVGFIVLLLRSIVLWGRGFDPDFNLLLFGSTQPLGKLYGLLKDIFAILVLIGASVFLYYRLVKKLPRLTLNLEGLIILGIIVTMMVADITYDGASAVRLAGPDRANLRFHVWEPAGSLAAFAFAGLPNSASTFLQHAGFWTHSSLVLIFLNILPYTKHFHIITGVPNVFFLDLTPRGRLRPIEDIEGTVERGETLGIRRITDFTWKHNLDFFTCTECGRCSDHCPATRTGKKLSPKHFGLDLRDFLYAHEKALMGARRDSRTSETTEGASPSDGVRDPGHDPTVSRAGGIVAPATDLVPEVIHPEVLWACTTCRACEHECPVFISFVDKIVDMRRHLVMERGEFPSQLQNAFQGIERSGNPWSFPAEDRGKWAEGLDVPVLAEKPDVDVLLWVGCAPSFDDRAKKVSRATAQLLKAAGVNFAILGTEETCTGDPARRAGNEFLFQMFAQQNVETLNRHDAGKKKIVTSCPHCFNTLKNEYPDFGGKFDVVHHSTFLAELVRTGRLKPQRVPRQNPAREGGASCAGDNARMSPPAGAQAPDAAREGGAMHGRATAHAMPTTPPTGVGGSDTRQGGAGLRVAFHDSCYLGRYNDVYDAPRDVLKAIPGLTVLEPAQTRDRGMCCGAGGANMFKEEEPGSERVNIRRTEQLLATQPDAVASGCPFCMRMLTDGLAAKHRPDIPQLDVAELLWESCAPE
jgi:Fe-S oxidoreductase